MRSRSVKFAALSISMDSELKQQLELLVLARVRQMVCELSELELLEYRRLVRSQAGYTDEKETVQ
jgi:hypothetical protein